MANTQGLSNGAVIEEADSHFVALCRSYRELLAYLAEIDRRGGWKRDGCRDMAQWISGRYGVSNWKARRWVAAAYALERLPLTSDALEMGALGLDKVVELTRFATRETEAKLITWARKVSASTIRGRGDREAKQSLEDATAAENARRLRWWYFDDGKRLGLEGEFPAAQGTAIATAIRRVADRIPTMPAEVLGYETDQESHLEQRCADALGLLAGQKISQDGDTDRATVVVHVPVDALEGDDDRGGCEIENGPVIHPRVAERLLCDGRLQPVLTGADESAVGIGFTSRLIPPWLMREVRRRDRTCTFPGCDLTYYLQAHHLVPWPKGPTEPWNLGLTCGFHHRLLHEHNWTARLEPDGVISWFRPDGTRYLPGPHTPRARASPYVRAMSPQRT